MDEAWHSGLEEPLEPNVNLRECCKSVLFGGLTELMCVVNTEFFSGSFKLKVKHCPHCGRDMKKVRAEVIFELQNDYGSPKDYLDSHPQAFGGVFNKGAQC